MSDYTLRLDTDAIERFATWAANAARTDGDAWLLAGIVEGARVVDLGCGPGAFLPYFAGLVGDRGVVVGVDQDPDAIATATALIDRHGLAQASAKLADIAATGLGPAGFDVAHLRLVLVHNGSRIDALLAEVVRLLRPGGSIVVTDGDMTGNRSSGKSRGFDDDRGVHIDRVVRAYVESMRRRGNDPVVGPRLPRFLSAAGFDVVDVRVATTVYAPDRPIPSIAPWEARDALVAEGLLTLEEVEQAGPAFADYFVGRQHWTYIHMYTVVARLR